MSLPPSSQLRQINCKLRLEVQIIPTIDIALVCLCESSHSDTNQDVRLSTNKIWRLSSTGFYFTACQIILCPLYPETCYLFITIIRMCKEQILKGLLLLYLQRIALRLEKESFESGPLYLIRLDLWKKSAK